MDAGGRAMQEQLPRRGVRNAGYGTLSTMPAHYRQSGKFTLTRDIHWSLRPRFTP